jgi:hypothetical protein
MHPRRSHTLEFDNAHDEQDGRVGRVAEWLAAELPLRRSGFALGPNPEALPDRSFVVIKEGLEPRSR